MAGSWGRYLIFAVFAGALVAYGGVLPWARPALIAGAGLAALFVAFGIGSHCRPVAVGWVCALFAPPAAIAAFQLSHFAGVHPWVVTDATLLGTEPVWTLNPDATKRFLCWTSGVAAIAMSAAWAFRGHRLPYLIYSVVGLVGLHAVFALVVVVSGLELPFMRVDGRARGTFIYTNHAAALWGACLPLAMILAARVHRHWLVIVAFLIIALVLSASRGGILTAAAVSAPLAWFLLPRRGRFWWAISGSMLIVGYLTIIGIELTSKRFEQLVQTNEGINLNGRVVLMQHGAELARDAGPLGSGAGSTDTVFWRHGSTAFDTHRVDHLHSDPLEWWLEFGWVGVVAALAGGGLSFLSLRDWGAHKSIVDQADHTRKLLRIGAGLGLLDLLLHSCADFIFHLEALALLASLLLAALAAGTQAANEGSPRSSWRPRLGLSLLGMCALLSAMVLWPQEGETLLAKRVRSALRFRIEHPELPLRPSIEEALAVVEPQTSVLRLMRLRSRTDLGRNDNRSEIDAQQDLRYLAHLVPGQPEVWAERLRRQLTGPNGATENAETSKIGLADTSLRLLKQAPGWPFGRQLLSTASSQLPTPEGAQLALAVLEIGAPLPGKSWPMLATALGRSELSTWLEIHGSAEQIRSALDWLRCNSRASVWFAAWKRSPPVWRLPPAQFMLRLRTSTDPKVEVSLIPGSILPTEPDGRRALAENFALAGLQIPPALSTTLIQDGLPWSIWSVPPNVYEAKARNTVIEILNGHLDKAWARTVLAECVLAAEVASGQTIKVGPNSDPRLIQLAITRATGPEADRLKLCLHSRRDPLWQPGTGGHWTWTWWFAQPGETLKLPNPGWVGTYIDEVWRGWSADTIRVNADLPTGLHRIVLVTPD